MIKTHGVVIKEMKYMESSKILTVFTKNYGKISVMARGVMRPKSLNTNSAVLFSLSEYILFKGRNFYYLNSSNVIDLFYDLRKDSKKFIHASYFSELVNETIMSGEDNPRVYDMIVKAFTVMNVMDIDYTLLLIAFQVKLISLLGYRPELVKCVNCGVTKNDNWSFDFEAGGIVCSKCRETLSYSTHIGTKAILILNQLLLAKFEDLDEISYSYDDISKLPAIMNSYITNSFAIRKIKSFEQLQKY